MLSGENISDVMPVNLKSGVVKIMNGVVFEWEMMYIIILYSSKNRSHACTVHRTGIER